MTSRRAFFVPLALGVALYLVLEPWLFQRAVYGRFVAPSSSTGRVVEALRREEALASSVPGATQRVLVVGDSRVAEGFSASRATSDALSFVQAAVPGSSLRIWRYLVRELDPDATRFAVLVVPVLSFEDHDFGDAEGGDPAARDYDLRYCAPLLRLGDLEEYASSFPTPEARLQAARAVLLRGFAYKHDLQAAFTSPFERRRQLRQPFEELDRAAREYDGRDELATEDALAAARRSALAARPSPAMAAYRTRWFEALLAQAARGRTRVLVVQLPCGPVPVARPPADPGAVLRRLAREGRLELLPDDLLLDLERPELFFDALHLNRRGRHLLTDRVAAAVRDALAKGR